MIALGVVQLDLLVPGAHSLKAKRQILKGLKDKIRRNYNVSVAEIDYLDKWQRTTIAVACVNSDRQFVNSVLSQVVNFTEREHCVELVRYELELF
ncbi:MAG: DUF503 domain-containing protein [Candidatus Omnitrophota bacterium]